MSKLLVDEISDADGTGPVTVTDGIIVNGTVVANGGAVFNEGGIDADFRVESDGNANMLFVDGGSNTVGIGDGAPTEAGLVVASIGTDANTSANLALKSRETSADTYLRFGRFGTGDDPSFLVTNNYYRTASAYVADYSSYGTTGLYFGDGEFSIATDSAGSSFPLQRMVFKVTEVVANEQGYDQDFRVESDANTHMLFVDASSNRIALGASSAFAAPNATVGIFSTTSGEPLLRLAGTTNGEVITQRFQGANTSGTLKFGDISFVPNAEELNFRPIWNGANMLTIQPSESTFNQDSQDHDFRVESDTNTHALFVDAGNNEVKVGTSTVNGTTANYMPLIAGQFSTQRGTATNLFANTWVTIHTFPTGAGNFIVSAAGGGTGNIADNTTGIVHVNATVSSYADLVLGTNVDLRMSGLSLQVYQSIFNGANINWSVMRIC